MDKPGRQQKPVEKAEKESRATCRQNPYIRSSTKGKSKSTSQVPGQPGPSELPQQSSPDLMTLVPSIVTKGLKQLEASGVCSKHRTPVPSIPASIVDPLIPTMSNEQNTEMDSVSIINNNCVAGNPTKGSSNRTPNVYTVYMQSKKTCDTPCQEQHQEVPVTEDLTNLRMPIIQTSPTTETNMAPPMNGGLNLMGGKIFSVDQVRHQVA